MPFEHEALVGHLYVVGGRAISTNPPGSLCEVAPQKAARGRETDTFFALVTPSGDATAAASFYERMAARAAERYFDSTGSVTAGLRDLFETLNKNLYDHNQDTTQPYEANLVCGVLRGSDLIIGRVGGCVALIQDGSEVTTFPEDLSDDESLFTAPLGVQPIPDVKLKQFRVKDGTRLLFGDHNLADLSHEQIITAMQGDEIADVLVGFRELARLHMSLMAAAFVPPDSPEVAALPAAESTTEVNTRRPDGSSASTAGAATSSQQSQAQKQRKRERKPGVLDVIWRHSKRAVGRVALVFANVFGLLERLIEHFFAPRSESQRRWLYTPIGAGTVVLLPVLVVALVMILWLSGTDESEFELCVQDLNERVSFARSPDIANSDRQRILDAWNHVLTKVDECDDMRSDDPDLNRIEQEAQSVIDRLQQITRIEAQVIQSMPQARLTRIIPQGQSLYVLDENNSLVYQIVLDDTGLNTTRPFYAIPEMRQGASAGRFTIGEIIDITYNTQTNRLVAVDASGLLVQCEVNFWRCEGERLVGAEQWGDPVAITAWGGNGAIYILDAEAQNGQIWRYNVSGGNYPTAPAEYFGGSARPALRGAVDLKIDERGNVYVLLADGTVTKFFNGTSEPFALTSFPQGQTVRSARSLYVDDTVTSQSIYIASQSQRTIFETSFIGNFNASYRVRNEDLFDLLEGVAVITGPDRQEIIYAISGNTIFALPKGG